MRRPVRRLLRSLFTLMLSASLLYAPPLALRTVKSVRAASNPALHALNYAPQPSASVLWLKRALGNLMTLFQTGPNLDTMRGNLPQSPAAYQQTGTLPAAGYDDPKPTATTNYDAYLTQLTQPGNPSGPAGSLPLQAADPTTGQSAVGGISVDLVNRQFNFTAPVLALAGRAGLGLGLALSYSSKVWIQAANTMVFNADRGYPAPGWRLGFGAIQIKDLSGSYANSVTGKQGLVYLEPSGVRRDLARVGSTDVYESYDSSYLRFDAVTQILSFPNGTQMKFGAYSYDTNVLDYQALPIEIKDRNGNYLSIYYKTLNVSPAGQKTVLDYVIDTAGRRIDFNYQNNRLVSLSQDRAGTPYYLVRLDYQPVTIQTSFANGVAVDPSNINGTQVYLPSRITYPTGVNLRLGYNNYGQMTGVEKWVPAISGQGAERKIAGTSFNYTTLGYCPYLTNRNEQAENWQGGQAQVYAYGQNGDSVTDPTGRYFVAQISGLTQSLFTWGAGQGNWTKKEQITYEQDAGLSYRSNPRPTESKIIESQNGSPNERKSTFSYTQQDGMWLPASKDDWAFGGGVYRRTTTTYTSYPTQRILGLPQQVSVYAGAGTTLLSRMTNHYDDAGSYTDSNGQSASYFIDATGDGVIQHDNANYGSGFTSRGNLTRVEQANVVNGAVSGARTIKRVSYDTNGNLRAEADGAGNRKQIVYTDNYSNKPGGVGQTHVYAYTTADPTGFRSGAQFNYYNGLTGKTFNLKAGSSTEEQVVTTTYDFADRPVQTTRPDGGWARTDYWDNWLGVVTAQQMDTGKIRYKFDLLDGAGRAFRKASDHPDGVSGKYSGQVFAFDKLGGTEDSSNVLAINGAPNGNGYWQPDFEDAGQSFLFTHLTRDELRRLKLVTLPDGNTIQYDFTGCGCAGNAEKRITDELGHQTISKTDFLGRLKEAIEPDDAQASGIYSKAEYFYDELDRLREIRHSDTTGAKIQYRYFNYDGYGRLQSETTPEAGMVTYTYKPNDLVEAVLDARGVTATNSYNTRNLLTGVSFSDSTPSASYTYDEYGARLTMADGEGQLNYSYNSLRQLQSETRTFTSLAGKTYKLSYAYNQADQVKSVNYWVGIPGSEPGAPYSETNTGRLLPGPFSIGGQVTNAQNQPLSSVTLTLSGSQSGQTSTNGSGQYSFTNLSAGGNYTVTPSLTGYAFAPSSRTYNSLNSNITSANFTGGPVTQTFYDKTVNYAYNSVGALAGVGTNLIGSDPNNTTNVLNTVTFRGSGALKSLNYGNGRRLTMGYNANRNQPISMKVDRVSNASDKVIDYQYEYYDANGNNNNRIRKMIDNLDSSYTTDYLYDRFNRLTHATASAYARFYTHDAWGNLKNFSGTTFNYDQHANGAPLTNRIASVNSGGGPVAQTYDAAGNLTNDGSQSFVYDGASRLKQASGGTSSYGYDGDGRRVRVTDNGTAVVYVYSSVLGQSVLEANSTGVQRAYVYEGGRVIAQQSPDGQFYWLHTSHLGTARSMTDVNGTLVYKGQFDPYGQALSEWSATGNTNLNTKKFTGYERDAATGLDYANARMYNNHRGRFTRPDPKGLGSARRELPGTLNRYAYANNDPVNHMDPTGEDWTDWIRFFAESACRDQGLGSVLSVGFLPGGQVSFLCSGGRALWETPTKQLLEELGEWQKPKSRGRRVPLLGAKLTKYDDEVNRLTNEFTGLLTDGSACHSFLSLLLGFNAVRGLADAVRAQRAFDGELSTISATDAGISSLLGHLPINQLMGLYQANAVRADSPDTGYFATEKDVYYTSLGINASTILHETLHYHLNLSDEQLAEKLGIIIKKPDGTVDTRLIDKGLADGGCK